MKTIHEIRDPIHVFIKLSTSEREVLDSLPLQRLRFIHQLGMTYYVYPGATHSRFEHSLGVMEVAAQIFDKIFEKPRHKEVELPDFDKQYWKRVVRMAALCHDVGHLPFSHTSEELLPHRMSHEDLTVRIIQSDPLLELWEKLHISPIDVAKVAVGPGKYGGDRSDRKRYFSDVERICSEIITSDFFGADRIDYLLRDSHHSGVFYGRFDHYRLIDTLCILPRQYEDPSGPHELSIGVESGGIQSAESLLFARYSMYSQLYLHPIRRIYDIHLRDFIAAWLPDKKYPTDVPAFFQMTDDEIIHAMKTAVSGESIVQKTLAGRILYRKHYKRIFSSDYPTYRKYIGFGNNVYECLCDKFGAESVRYDNARQSSALPEFPVIFQDGSILSSLSALKDQHLITPRFASEGVYIHPRHIESAKKWLTTMVEDIKKSGE